MITGLLFALSQNPPSGQGSAEGGPFPPPGTPAPQPRPALPVLVGAEPRRARNGRGLNWIRLSHALAALFALAGTALLLAGAAEWSFHPDTGLKVRTALFQITLPAGGAS